MEKFAAQIETNFVFAQVLIRRQTVGFQLCHVADSAKSCSSLRSISLNEIRILVQTTETGAFRPLKSSPNLATGWTLSVRDEAELEKALNEFYPGAIADWSAVQSESPPITNYREFVQRQTGMYRITAMLTDAQAAPMIRACCHKGFCLKARLWSVDGLPVDSIAEKSIIFCLEPCALLLEFARKVMRLEQQEKTSPETSLEGKLKEPSAVAEPGSIREADFNSPENPRLRRFIFEKQS